MDARKNEKGIIYQLRAKNATTTTKRAWKSGRKMTIVNQRHLADLNSKIPVPETLGKEATATQFYQ
jgi:hypothetical protein